MLTTSTRSTATSRSGAGPTDAPISDARRAVLDVDAELDRQVAAYLARGWAEAAGIGDADLTARLEPLRAVARGHVAGHVAGVAAPEASRVPFVLVLPGLVAPHDALPRLTLAGRTKPGSVSRHLPDVERFVPVKPVELPGGPAYVLLDVERGEEFCSVRPADALVTIRERGRSPLTIDEGIALVAVHPDTLERNACFMLSASRCGDQRVPALWISAGAPTLGWCWDRNPHTWLGSASAGARAGTGARP